MSFVLLGPARAAFEIKKSRFLVQAAPVDSVAAAMAFIANASDPDARHNCFAYRVGANYRFDDADEPAGTAGRPILQAIDGQQLDQVVVVVTRWFGGIKLGAGGLVRAYGGSAAECLRLADKQAFVTKVVLQAQVPFDQLAAAHHVLEQAGAEKMAEHFSEIGATIEFRLPAAQADAITQRLRDIGRGRIETRSAIDPPPR